MLGRLPLKEESNTKPLEPFLTSSFGCFQWRKMGDFSMASKLL